MRKIKFRLWDNKKMQDSFELDNEFDCISGFIGYGELMQFTGLLDKNGKEIFEGDLLQSSDEKIMVVGWSDKFASFVLNRVGWAFSHWFGESCNPEDCVIIGNIHEHKHLLK